MFGLLWITSERIDSSIFCITSAPFCSIIYYCNLITKDIVLTYAAVAELADAQCSGRCMVFHVQVRLLSAAF